VKVSNGTVYGAAGQTASQALSDDQVKKISQDLHLTAADGAETGKATDYSVVHFQDQVNSNYQQYWRLLGNGSVSGNVYTLNADRLPLYRALAAAMTNTANPSDQQVQSFANSQYQSVTGALQTMLGDSWVNVMGSSPVASFAYAASSDQVKALTDRAVWDEGQLKSYIHGSALQASVPVGVGNPNITGRDVKLVTSGGIGNLAAPVMITLKELQDGTLTQDQLAALAQAEVPGTVVGVDADGAAVDSVTKPVAFRVQQTAPVFINASGKFSAQAGAQTYVQSTGQSFTLDQIVAGGDVSVAAPQSILNAGTSATQIVTPGDVTLLAGSGDIGSANAPLSIQAGRLLAAFAGGNAYLQGLGGDFVFGRVAAGGTASLDAVDGSLLPYLDGVTVSGGGVALNALNDVGSVARYVQVNVGADGTLDGSAGGAAYIKGPDATSALHIGSYSADAGLHIVAAGDLSAQQLQSSHGVVSVAAGGNARIDAVNSGISTAASGDVALTAVGDLTVGAVASTDGSITLLAGNALKVTNLVATDSGAISASAATVDIAAGGELVSASGAIDVGATGNVYVNRIASGKTNGQAITVTSSTGRIVEADADAEADIVATGAGALVSLSARDGIGDATRTGLASLDTSTPNALEVQATSLSASSAQGGVHLHALGDLTLSEVTAQGAVQLVADGALTATQVQSTAGSVGLRATAVAVPTVVAGTSVDIEATHGNVKVDTVQGQGDVTLVASQGIGGRSATRFGRVQSLAGAVSLQAQGGDVMGNATQAAGDVQVLAANSIDAAALTSTGGNVLATATSGDLRVTKTNALKNADLHAGGAITFDDVVAAQGNATLRAQGDIAGKLLSAVQGDATVDSTAGQIHVDHIVGSGVVLSSQAAISGMQLDVGQRLVVVSDSVDEVVQHSSSDQALQVSMSGSSQPAMGHANLVFNSPVGVRFDHLAAVDANLQMVSGSLEVVNGTIDNRMLVTNPSTSVLMDNNDVSLRQSSDVQIYSPTKTFSMKLNGNTLDAQGATIMYRNEMNTAVGAATNHSLSVAEQANVEVALAQQLVPPPVLPAIQTTGSLMNFSGIPVRLTDVVSVPVLTDVVPVPAPNQNDDQKIQ
jgi:hypothetical protein